MRPADPRPAEVLLLGDPIGHSLSAVFQNAAFRAAGIDARYLARQVAADRLAQTVDGLRGNARVLGANVTVPHKLAVVAHLDRLTGTASALRAVNTISRDRDLLVGHNTDQAGIERSLREAGLGAVRVALVLGAGGAARAVAAALSTPDLELLIASRSPAAAGELCELLRLRRARPIPFDQVNAVLGDPGLAVDLIVNATPIGLDGRSLPFDPRCLRAGQLVADLVYQPVWTPLLQAARAAGARTVNGLGMLLYQGAAAFEIWTGRAAPLAVMRGALERAAGASIGGDATHPSIMPS